MCKICEALHSNVLSTVAPTHSLPFWFSKLHSLMPSSHHLQSSCADARLGPPFLPEFATLILQPSRFANKLMPAQMPPSHRQTNDANLLHPCMSASPLWCTTPTIRSGSLPLWYASCWKTATKCTPLMAWSTTARDDTFMNAVSSPLTLPSCHSSHTTGSCQTLHFCNTACTWQACTTAVASACCTCNDCDSKMTDTSCPWSCPCARAYVCNTQHSPCAAPSIRLCPHHTKCLI